MKKRLTLMVAALCLTIAGWAVSYKQVNDIRYTVKTDSYAQERLKLDVYYPEDLKDCPVVIWFHGGGLEGGNKEIPARLKNKGYVVVGVNYRLLPKVTVKETLDDSAEAVACVFRHAAEYGGDTKNYNIDADEVMLYAPFSGQAITHYNVRKMQGLTPLQPTIDEYAPLYWVRKDCPPFVLICGDRELELFGRYDENQYLARMMKLVGHQQTYLYEIDGHGHGGMVEPSFHILDTHIKMLLGEKVNP